MELQTAPDLPLELVDILLTNLCDEDVLVCMLISKSFLKVGLKISFERPIPILFRYCKQALQKIKTNLDGSATARPLSIELIHPDKDIQLIEQVLASNVKVIKLSLLQNVPILADKAKWLCKVIGTNTTLKELSVQTSGAGAVWFGNALLLNNSLKHFMVESNTISQDSIASFANVLRKNTTLTSLAIGASSTSHNGTVSIDKMRDFADALAHNTTLKSLRLFNTYFSAQISVLLVDVLKERNRTLTSLELPGSLLCSDATSIASVLDVINHSTSLTKLDLSQTNNYDYTKTTQILDALKTSQYIEDLNLSFFDAGSNVQAQDALRDYFQNNHALQHIKLESCGLYDVTAISAAILSNPMLLLRSLSLNNNYLTDFRPIYKLLLRENYSVISVLSLQACNLNANSIELLCHALTTNKRLTKLNIAQNPIADVGAELLARMLTENETLTHLNLGRNSILDQGAYHLARVFGVLHADDADLQVKTRLETFNYANYAPIMQANYYNYNNPHNTQIPSTQLSKVTHEAQLIYLSKYHQNKAISVLNMERNLLSKEAQAAFRKVMEKHQKVHVDLAYCDNPNAEENCCIS